MSRVAVNGGVLTEQEVWVDRWSRPRAVEAFSAAEWREVPIAAVGDASAQTAGFASAEELRAVWAQFGSGDPLLCTGEVIGRLSAEECLELVVAEFWNRAGSNAGDYNEPGATGPWDAVFRAAVQVHQDAVPLLRSRLSASQ